MDNPQWIQNILLRQESGFYLPMKPDVFLESGIPELQKTFRISKVLTCKAKALLEKATPTTNDLIQEISLSPNFHQSIQDFTQKNFYERFKDFYTPKETTNELNMFPLYFANANPKGSLFFKNEQLVGVILYHEYKPHPALNKPTRHVGYWGYDSILTTSEEARFIKYRWAVKLTENLTDEHEIDCSINTFNPKSLSFASKMGFQQEMWRLDRRL